MPRKCVKYYSFHTLPKNARHSIYSAFNHRGNGLLNADRVARFSATALPFAASEKADVR
jgi:hypothetical protein